jgi:hypothetical protein
MAIQGLNGFNLADRVLTVQRASTGKAMNTAISTGTNMTPTGVPSLRTLGRLFLGVVLELNLTLHPHTSPEYPCFRIVRCLASTDVSMHAHAEHGNS